MVASSNDRITGNIIHEYRVCVNPRFARFFVVEGRVLAAAEMFVAPFVAEHVTRARMQLGTLADEIGGALQKEFGGRRAFEEEPEGAQVQ